MLCFCPDYHICTHCEVLTGISLQVALCNAYVRIAKICSIHIWRPGILVKLLYSDKPCPPLIICIKVAVGILGSELIGEGARNDCGMDLSLESGALIRTSVGQKRPSQNIHTSNHKRQRRDESKTLSSPDILEDAEGFCLSTRDPRIESADDMRRLLLSFIDFLGPGNLRDIHVKPEIAIMALSKLSLVFCSYQPTSLSTIVFCQVLSWMHWVCNEVHEICQNFRYA